MIIPRKAVVSNTELQQQLELITVYQTGLIDFMLYEKQDPKIKCKMDVKIMAEIKECEIWLKKQSNRLYI